MLGTESSGAPPASSGIHSPEFICSLSESHTRTHGEQSAVRMHLTLNLGEVRVFNLLIKK